MSKIIKNSKLALIGLVIFFATSLVMAGGGKPKFDKANSTMRTLPVSEAKGLVERIPEILTEALGPAISDVELDKLKIENLDLGLQELSNPLLQLFFPKASFYSFQKLYISGEERPRVLIAVVGNKLYHVPSDFNRLLLEHNLEVNDKNIIELAKAFVVIAFMDAPYISYWEGKEFKISEVKEITFLEGKRIKEYDKEWYVNWSVQIKCKIEDTKDIQTWKFSFSTVRKGQFSGADVFINNKRQRNYQLKTYEKEKRGELDEGEIRGHFPYFSVFYFSNNLK